MDVYADHAPSLTAPASAGAEVTPSNTAELARVSRALYVGAGGDLALELASGSQVTLGGVPGGTVLPVRARRVRASGTTASAIVALW
jgi:hypothetical protein